MGGASSKAARSFSKPSSKPSTVRTPNHLLGRDRPPLAADRRNEAVDMDSKDPHLLGNLGRLGPVRVGREIQNSLSASSNINRMLKTREESETEANSAEPIQNRLLAVRLIDLLDERKTATSVKDLDRLAERYDIDRSVLESLGRYVNSPSEDQATKRKVVDEDGSERVLTTAKWVSPHIS